MQSIEAEELNPKLSRFRTMFKAAVEKQKPWRRNAKTDYRFYFGDQWDESDRQSLRKQKRPAITINRVRPFINLISGYQRINRYEPDFKPRTAKDLDLCKVRKGVTKYIMDSCKFNKQESRYFMDGTIGGLGWAEVGYEFDYHAMDGKVCIKRRSPFDIYIDPESREPDLSDAEYVIDAKWVSKNDLIRTYPEFKEDIETFTQLRDQDEDLDNEELEPVWYDAKKKKCRLITVWYKDYKQKTYYAVGGQIVTKENLIPGMMPTQTFRVPQTEIRCYVMLGDVELEDIPSPYKHGRFPFVPYHAYYIGEEGEEPAGIVRDLQDVQREHNKRRSQFLHLINTMANRGWFLRKGQPQAKKQLETAGSTPGVVIEFEQDPPKQFDTTQVPAAFAQFDNQASEDFREISGINEAMLGQEMAAGISGKAIELRQRQAVTQVAGLFDNLRETKEMILHLLWGSQGAPGLVPQYYTDEKTFRILGDNGQEEFVTVNQQQVVGYDWLGNAIHQTLNDLSVGEFDVVISEAPATPTQRIAQYYGLLELLKLMPPNVQMLFADMVIEASDFDNKEELKQRLQAALQPQAPPAQLPPGQEGAPPPGQPGQPGIVPQGVAAQAMQAAL